MPTKTEIKSIVIDSPQGDNLRANVRKCHQPCTRLLEVTGSSGGFRHEPGTGMKLIECFEEQGDSHIVCGPELAKRTK